MERTITKQEQTIKDLKHKFNQFNESGGNLQCCCDELRTIYLDKESALLKLSDYWRMKTNELISTH